MILPEGTLYLQATDFCLDYGSEKAYDPSGWTQFLSISLF